jgi:hypothetical protein
MSKFERVRNYYQSGLRSAQMVLNAIGRWITQEEADEILGLNNKNEQENI